MLKILFIVLISIIFQACQVKENVSASKQLANVIFPGATFTTVLPDNGWKKLGDDLDIKLIFPTPVDVTMLPFINAQIGSNTRSFFYESGSGTSTLVFRYTVTASDLDSDGIIINPSVNLNGGSLTYFSSQDLISDVPTTLVIPENLIRVDGVVPTLTSVTPPAGGNFSSNQKIKYYLNFNENVQVVGTPKFNLVNMGVGSPTADYKSGSGTKKLEFSHTLEAVDSDVDGFTSGSFIDFTNSSITDLAGNFISPIIPTTASNNILINVTQPIVTGISTPPDTTYVAGNTLDFVVTFSQPVSVTDFPSIPIFMNTGTYLATYVLGTGTDTLTFRYTVLLNHVAPNGISLVSPMVLNGGSIKNMAGTQNAALIYSPPVTSGIVVDASTGPYILSAIRPNEGVYTESQTLDFKLNFSRPVNVLGTPRLPIIVGQTTAYATVTAGDGTNILTFSYQPSVGEEDLNGISLVGQLDLSLPGSSIKDFANRDAILTYLVPNTLGVLVDATFPTIVAVGTSSSGNFSLGQQLNFSVTFSEAVKVTPLPSAPQTLTIKIGATNYNATYISGDGTNKLNFKHVIGVSEVDVNGIDFISPLVLNGGTIKDLRAHDSSLTFTDSLSFTNNCVTLASCSVAASSITFSSLSTTGSFTLNTPDGNVTFTFGASSYGTTICSTCTDAQKATALANQINNSSDAILSLYSAVVSGGDTVTVSIDNGIYLDSVTPTASFTPPTNGNYKLGDSLFFVINWSEPTFISGTPKIAFSLGLTPAEASYVFSLSNNLTSVFRYVIQAGDMAPGGITSTGIIPGSGFFRDYVGNVANTSITAASLPSVIVDGIIPYVSTISAPATGLYGVGSVLTFTFNWSENVTIAGGTPYNKITIGSTELQVNVVTPVINANITTVSYTILTNQLDTDGISMLPALFLPSGVTIKDQVGNNALLTLNLPNLTQIKVDGIAPMILGITPPVNKTYIIGENIDFHVTWSEPVTISTIAPYPRIVLTIGSQVKYAVYNPSLSTPTNSVFRYTVALNDSDANGIIIGTIANINNLTSSIDLNGATIKDAGLNNAVLVFPTPNLSGVLVDGVTAIIDPVNPVSTNLSPGTYEKNNNLDFIVHWTKPVDVDTSGGTPFIQIMIDSGTVNAAYIGGTGTNSLTFRYKVLDGNFDSDGVSVKSPVFLNGGTIQFSYMGVGLDAGLSFSPSPVAFPAIKVDAKPPVMLSLTTSNTVTTSQNSIFKPGDIIKFSVVFDEPVIVTSNLSYVKFFVGSTTAPSPKFASYDSGSGTTTLTYLYTIPANSLVDLDGIKIDTSIFNPSVIEDQHDNIFLGAVNGYQDTDYIYYSNTLARFHIAAADYQTSTCSNGVDACITSVKDISGSSNFLVPSAGIDGPQISSTYGISPNFHQAMQFNNQSILKVLNDMVNVKYIIIVMKTMNDASILPTLSNHNLLTRKDTSNYSRAIEMTSDATTHAVLMNPAASIQKNSGGYSGTSTSVSSGLTYWAANTQYIFALNLSSPSTFYSGSFFGGVDFKGQIAEVIFLDNSAVLSGAQMDNMVDQLNVINNAY